MSERASCCERLNENTIEPEVFQNMTDFKLPTEYNSFDLSIRMQFPKFSRGLSCHDFKSFIQEYVGEEYVAGLGRLAFPNEWQLEVNNRDVREKLIRMQKTKINMRTCWISPLSQSEVRGHIHWLPTQTRDQDVSKALAQCGDVLFIERQLQTKFDYKIKSDMFYFALFLRNGFTMDDIPYFITVDGHQGFVSVRGRAPVCFHCKGTGHRKSECEKFRVKLKSYCSNRPGRSIRKRPRGKRFKSVEQIMAKRKAEETAAVHAPTGSAEQSNVPEPMDVGGDNASEQSKAEGVVQIKELEQTITKKVCLEVEPPKEVAGDKISEREVSMEGLESVESMAEGDDRLGVKFNKVLELPSIMVDGKVVQNPITQLRELEKDLVDTLTNTADVLNEKMKAATHRICEELKVKKKKRKQRKK